MKRISYIIDTVLTLAALYLLGVFVIGYFSRDSLTTVFFAVVFAFAATFFITKLARRREVPQIKKRKLEELMNKFVFSPPEYSREFLLKALSHKGEAREEGKFIVIGKSAFLPRFSPEKATASLLSESYAAACALGAKRLVILSALGADERTNATAALLEAPTVAIWDFERVYAFLSYLGYPPTEKLTLAKKKRKFRAVLSGVLRRENARKFLWVAIVTLLFARFVPYSVLYVAVSALAVTLSLLCFFYRARA